MRGVVRLEHVNLNIGTNAEDCLNNLYFFRDVLGLTVDPDHKKSTTLWMNVSTHHQLHLPRRMPVQYLQGANARIDLTTNDRDARKVLGCWSDGCLVQLPFRLASLCPLLVFVSRRPLVLSVR